MTVTPDGGATTTVTLKTKIMNIGELVTELNAQLAGTGVTAEADGDKVKLLSDKKITLGGTDLNTIMGAGAPTTSTETPPESEARLTGKYGFAEGTDLAALLGTSVKDALLKNNASILFEVMSVNKDSKNVNLLETKNNTSSLKAGFYSNRSAIVEYETASGKFTSKRYPKPVVQSDIDLKFKKIDSEDNGVLPGAKFRLYYAKLTGSDESLISNWHREGPSRHHF